MQIPPNAHAVTPEWLTATLHERGFLSNAAVKTITVEPMTEGISSQLARLRLTYDLSDSNAPGSMIAKFSSTDPAILNLMQIAGMYEREVRFYNELAHTVNVRIPQCYYARHDPVTAAQVLLLEDLGPARSGDSNAGWPIADAKTVIRELAKLHGSWWNDPDLAQKPWLDNTKLQRLYIEAYPTAYPGFLDRAGDLLSDDTRIMVEKLQDRFYDIARPLDQPPVTLVHHDPNMGNILLDVDGEQGSIAMLDWQLVTIGRGTLDFVLVMMLSFRPDDRRTHEAALLRTYHQALIDNGVRDYTFEQAQEDYRRGVLRAFAQFVVSIGRGAHDATIDEKRKGSFPRLIAAVEDLNCGALLT